MINMEAWRRLVGEKKKKEGKFVKGRLVWKGKFRRFGKEGWERMDWKGRIGKEVMEKGNIGNGFIGKGSIFDGMIWKNV